jgi:hypothetical protein
MYDAGYDISMEKRFLPVFILALLTVSCNTAPPPPNAATLDEVVYTEMKSEEDVYALLSELEQEREKLTGGIREAITGIPILINGDANPEYQIARDSYMFANGYTSSIHEYGRIGNQWIKAVSPNSRYVFTFGGMTEDDFISRYIYFENLVILNLQALAVYNALCLKYGAPVHTDQPSSERFYYLYVQKLPDRLILLSAFSRAGCICLELGPSIVVRTPDGIVRKIQ